MWDQQTFMPPGGVATRAETLATLSLLAHKYLTSDDTRRALENLDGAFDKDTIEAATVRVARREFNRATRLPSELVADIARACSIAEPAWVEARKLGDFAMFAPHLERVLGLQQQAAEHLGYQTHPYDALLENFEPGTTKAELETLFNELKTALVPLVAKITNTSNGRDARRRSQPLYGVFDEAKQEQFGREVITRLGYDFTRGRQDRSVHPFCINFGANDVRITTRFEKDWLQPALFGTLHEAGHAMYEQGVDAKLARSPLAGGCSMGVHESQSRLWENVVGRSKDFWIYFYPQLQNTFPEQLKEISLDDFYQAINAVERTSIRVEADEVTYNLHVLLRFELELALFENNLKVKDLPSAWNEKMQAYFGLTPPNEAEGVLQDIHWSGGSFAYFPTYTVGNVLAVQLYEAAIETHPQITDEIRRGEFQTLHAWLAQNIYAHGKRYDPSELIERATSKKLDAAPYLKYLSAKFGELYDVQ